ncbi:hypothetical protein K457DRAFT_544872 [Linnemannia elongata AG-77]|uniref:Uncharacterized protein n=1 Tax=Linnemannia elongata AG-77 TaxID=1314771 RepID=A0A197JUR0_9FUNG|nr:hypothetical protein K457DRAFT_544872 [Linnemannia elongata AG-77]
MRRRMKESSLLNVATLSMSLRSPILSGGGLKHRQRPSECCPRRTLRSISKVSPSLKNILLARRKFCTRTPARVLRNSLLKWAKQSTSWISQTPCGGGSEASKALLECSHPHT